MRDTVWANVASLQEAMAAQNLDALVAFSPENVLYLSGALIMTQKLDPARLAAAVFPRNSHGQPVAIVHPSEEAITQRDSWIRDVRTYDGGADRCVAMAAEVLESRGLASGRIGVEMTWLPVQYFGWFQSWLPQVTLAPADGALAQARLVKTPAEVAVLRRAALATGDALRGAFAAARAGDTEQQLASDLCSRIIRSGAEGTWLTLSSGENLHVRHHFPGARRLCPGDLVLAVGGGSFGGYYPNLARMAVVGEASATRAQRYRWLYGTLGDIISQVRAGMTIGDIHRAASAAYTAEGHTFTSQTVGHSIGLLVHDWTLLRAGDETVLQPGMTLQIELGLPDGEGFRFSIEDLVLVTDGAPEPLSDGTCWGELPEIAV